MTKYFIISRARQYGKTTTLTVWKALPVEQIFQKVKKFSD